MNNCSSCGKELKVNAKFCPSCGKKRIIVDLSNTNNADVFRAGEIEQVQPKNIKTIVIVSAVLLAIGVGYFTLQKSSLDSPSYKLTREKLIREGWRPITQTKTCSSECQKWREAGWIETEACTPTGVMPCIFVFRKQNGSLLKVYTEGEEDPWVVKIENLSSR